VKKHLIRNQEITEITDYNIFNIELMHNNHYIYILNKQIIDFGGAGKNEDVDLLLPLSFRQDDVESTKRGSAGWGGLLTSSNHFFIKNTATAHHIELLFNSTKDTQ